MRTLLFIGCVLTSASLHAAQEQVVKTISHGQSVELSKYLDSSHNTIVEFYADW